MYKGRPAVHSLSANFIITDGLISVNTKMANTGLKGPYVHSAKRIDEVVTRKSAGVYVLEREGSSEGFVVDYVGRSDVDVNERLQKWVGVNGYKKFKFDYFDSPKAAFEKECNVYHDFTPSDNSIHPQRPEGSSWQCPRCDKFKILW